MKKLVLGLTVASLVGISGCGDSPKDPAIPEGTLASGGSGSTALTRPIFKPGNGELPLPNDLLFSGTLDLTLNIPVDDPADFSDPAVSLSALDGWSSVAPIAIGFENNDGVDLDPATIVPGATVRMWQVNTERPEALPGTGIPVPTGKVNSIIRELTPGVDYVATYAGPLTAAVIPLRPLEQQESYMIVVTDDVTDANGNKVIADGQYNVSKREEPIPAGLPTSGLEPVRVLVNAMERAANSAGVNKDKIALSFQFTVQSMGQVVAANKGFYIDFPLSLGATPYTSFSSLMTDTSPFTGQPSLANLYKGEVGLTYFLGVPQTANDPAIVSTFFTGADNIPNPAFDPADPNSPQLIPNPFAGGFTTYANPLVAPQGAEIAPLMVSLPKDTPSCSKPAAGYPVMIFQHGITSNRTNLIAIADAMAQACTAVVAMDMPLHGVDANNPVHLGLQLATGGAIGLFEGYAAGGVRERTFGIDLLDNATGAPGPDGTADSSGAHTINLTNLQVSRDNNRQAVLDLLALEKAIPFMDVDGDMAPDFDINNVSFMGHSWGGIVGNMFLAHSDYVKVAVMANSGGNLTGMIDGSQVFGDPVKAGLAAQGIETGSADYQAFLFAAQTVLDDGDAINSNATNVSRQIPTLLLQVLNDNTVPNFVATSPTAGTTPMAAMLGLTTVTATDPGETVVGSRLFSKLNQGLHSTVLSPLDATGAPTLLPVTAEMQTHIVSFVASGGQAITVVDPTLLD